MRSWYRGKTPLPAQRVGICTSVHRAVVSKQPWGWVNAEAGLGETIEDGDMGKYQWWGIRNRWARPRLSLTIKTVGGDDWPRYNTLECEGSVFLRFPCFPLRGRCNPSTPEAALMARASCVAGVGGVQAAIFL